MSTKQTLELLLKPPTQGLLEGASPTTAQPNNRPQVGLQDLALKRLASHTSRRQKFRPPNSGPTSPCGRFFSLAPPQTSSISRFKPLPGKIIRMNQQAAEKSSPLTNLVAEFRRHEAKLLHGGGQAAIDRQHAKARLTA